MHAELTDTNVGVTIALPGAVVTNISSNSGVEIKSSKNDNSSKLQITKADDTAKQIIEAIEKDEYKALTGKEMPK